MAVKLTFDAGSINTIAAQIKNEFGPDAVKRALGLTFGEVQKYAIDTVASHVSGLYKISADDVKSTNSKGPTMTAVLTAGGGDGAVASIVFSGRTLTLDKFGFSPSMPPRSNDYRVRTEILRGQGKSFAPPPDVFIPRSRRTNKIPFHRLSGADVAKRKKRDPKYAYGGRYRGPIAPIHSLSIPQMITNEQLEPILTAQIGEKLLSVFAEQFLQMGGGG